MEKISLVWHCLASGSEKTSKYSCVSSTEYDFPCQPLPCLHAQSPWCLKQVLTMQTNAMDDVSKIPQLGCIFGIQVFSDAHIWRFLEPITSSTSVETLYVYLYILYRQLQIHIRKWIYTWSVYTIYCIYHLSCMVFVRWTVPWDLSQS